MPAQTDSDRLQALLEGLNEPQREAVTHGEGPLLILAGAGSGKTTVLTRRVAFLIFSGQVRPSEVLAITFTNKAAAEMRGRVEQLVGHSTRGMWLMTFHAACARILRAKADLLGYTRSFTIYDQADSRRLTKRCMDEIGVDPKRFTPAAVQSRISSGKNKLFSASAYRDQADGPFEEMIAEVYRLYERELETANAMDFDDLLFRAVSLFELHPDARRDYATAFRHVLVDEYQDTNHAQYRLLQLLTEPGDTRSARIPEPASGGEQPARGEAVAVPGHRNLAVVGDDAQSIYGFRGADVSNILDFERDFPDARVVKLEQNYRSTQNILSAANAVISHNREGIDKRLWSELGDGSTLHVRSLQDEHAEARLIVGEIERLLDEDLATRSEIAVLYRTNALSRVVEDALMRNEIAYQVIGGTKFYERAEVKDAMAYLSLIANPQDAVSFQRIVNSPRRGIGQASVAKVLAHAAATDLPIWKVASVPQEVPGLGAAAMKAIGRFMATMSELRELAGSGVSVAELLEQTLQKTGYLEVLQAERTIEAQGRLENLEQLIDVAAEFDEREDVESEDQVALAPAEQQQGSPPANPAQDALAFDDPAPAAEAASGLGLFLQQIALVADADSRRDEDGLITLMTLHNAKGLEYPVVFIAGCEEGVFPHSRAIDEGGIEEERRLFYVGVTRAMRELYLTYARRRRLFGEPTASLPSSFLEEVPGELIDFEQEQERGFGFSGAPSASIRPALGGFPALGGGVRATDARRRAGNGGAAPTFRLGEDVVHAAFGEGVVTAVEPDGVIVVRFAGDGSERKLIAEYAPVSRR